MFSILMPGLAWCFLVVGLAVATRLPKRAMIGMAVGLAVAMVIGFGTTSLAVSLGRTPFTVALIASTSTVSVFLYLCIALVPVCAVNLVWWLIERQGKGQSARPTRSVEGTRSAPPTPAVATRVRVVRVLTVMAVCTALVITGVGLGRAHRLGLTPIDLTVPDLPQAFDGVSIAVVTDLHVGATTLGGFLPGVVDQVNQAEPDLIIIAGDLVDGEVDSLGAEVSVLADLRADLGVVVTTGNHEFYSDAAEWLTYFRSLGLTVLDNDGYRITRGSASIEVLGINDWSAQGRRAPNPVLACEKAHGSPCSAADHVFRILAAHQPRQVFLAGGTVSQLGVDLQVSGHTHGGQLWPLAWLMALNQPVVAGVETIDTVSVVTSRGAGTWGPPVRVGADPEIPIITLHSA